jgi:hypothetical protein
LRVRPCFLSCLSCPSPPLPPLVLYQEPSNVQQTFSKERTPTVWRIIPALEFLIKRWESMVEQPRFRDVKDAITEGVLNLKKWYRKVDNTSSAYFICLGTSLFMLVCLTVLPQLPQLSFRSKRQRSLLSSSLGAWSICCGYGYLRSYF